MSEWQPIATAPRTSKAVLVYVPEIKCSFAVTWTNNEDIRRGWHIFGGDWRECLQRASHWQPLPKPPEQQP